MTHPSYWQTATNYLYTKDQLLARLIDSYPNEILTNLNNPFHTLIRAVVGQQISVKAAETVWHKLRQKLSTISPQAFALLSEADLKSCGLSRQKIAYMSNIAHAFEQGLLKPNQWHQMSDKQVIKQLIQIKGVGAWTAQMFLIFHLHRPDIFPMADVGLINAVKFRYGDLTKDQIINRSQQWKPYRTVATWYLWLSLDPITIQY